MTEFLDPDLCVIGAGSGGLSVAAAAAAFGVPVVLIEKNRMGGDCLNVGCIPSKAIIAAAKRAHVTRMGRPLGVSSGNIDVDFAGVQSHIQRVIAKIAPMDSAERFTALGVRVIKGEARFQDDDTLVIDDQFEIKARRFVIATGSSPAVPPIDGLSSTPFLTNETIFDLADLPQHLLVIGAGAVGLELAQAYRRLGAAVTVFEMAHPLPREDAECVAVVLDQLCRDGVDIRPRVDVLRVSGSPGAIEAVVKTERGEEVVAGTHLLLAAGRRPGTDGLGLEKSGIKTGPNGILVDKRLRTTNRRVYAIGDVAGGPQFTHVANYHAGLVIRHALFRLPVTVNNDMIPRVTFTDPELAHVGLTETEAVKRGHRIRVLRWPFHDNDRAQSEGDTRGHIKVVTDRRGRIVGTTIVGTGAGELIAPWALALARKMTVRDFATLVMAYPTRSEAGKRAAIDFYAAGARSRWVRRLIGFLRLFG